MTRRYYSENKEKVLIANKIYAQNNKEKTNARNRKRYKNRYQVDKEYQLNYRKINKIKLAAYKKNYEVERRKVDINYRLLSSLRTRLNYAIKNNSKSKGTIELLGCTVEELKLHLQVKFIENMNWSNYGEWEIDHIIPCAAFDLSLAEEQKKCFNYRNLQPLWKSANRKKGAKIHG